MSPVKRCGREDPLPAAVVRGRGDRIVQGRGQDLEDVGQQVLMRGLDTTCPFVRPGLPLFGYGHRSYRSATQPTRGLPNRGPIPSAARLCRAGAAASLSSSNPLVRPPAEPILPSRPAPALSRRAQWPSRKAACGLPKGLSLTAASTAARSRASGASPQAWTAPPRMPSGATVRQMSQMKPAISRATAVTATVGLLPVLIRCR
jgi:hypothetical protein